MRLSMPPARPPRGMACRLRKSLRQPWVPGRELEKIMQPGGLQRNAMSARGRLAVFIRTRQRTSLAGCVLRNTTFALSTDNTDSRRYDLYYPQITQIHADTIELLSMLSV